ncbi:OmpW/AlkL family protein [Noviherbaspirillum aridicola]|uniref:Outer membrane protein n=1 Tax=Noviherbaspirillum aridicola TaxID=2849687 RepID=A0ABQ4Q449_9BURK|nr:OmpW family outer membrane protein [Noviherbaspirillum aridicola]GIZ51868.1 outer membrane protein [Noviherbaspirillum aridicola]
MKKTVLALAALGLLAGQAMAQESPWLVRARVVNIDTANKSSGLIGGDNAIRVSDKTIPELDISYFFTPNIAAELILTYPQKHTVRHRDAGRLGTFKHLPPTLSLQYHFTPKSTFSPYVGAGVNYTRISSVKLGGGADLENDSFGLALQAGFDYKLDKNWSINFDVKKVQIRSDVTAGGATVAKVKVDPLLIGVGIGYRF